MEKKRLIYAKQSRPAQYMKAGWFVSAWRSWPPPAWLADSGLEATCVRDEKRLHRGNKRRDEREASSGYTMTTAAVNASIHATARPFWLGCTEVSSLFGIWGIVTYCLHRIEIAWGQDPSQSTCRPLKWLTDWQNSSVPNRRCYLAIVDLVDAPSLSFHAHVRADVSRHSSKTSEPSTAAATLQYSHWLPVATSGMVALCSYQCSVCYWTTRRRNA